MLRKTKEGYLYEAFRYCECGCGYTLALRDKQGHLRKYIYGHMFKGKKFNEDHKRKLSEAKKGERNPNYGRIDEKHPMWKGDNVGNAALHQWIQRRLPKPELCQICNLKPPKELSNISGKYLRDITDFQWLCILCHRIFDNQIENNLHRKIKNGD